jgi:hypothetical protein
MELQVAKKPKVVEKDSKNINRLCQILHEIPYKSGPTF